jgi:phenylpropionate dioxygenase-like ring-hydroxylating dioxygenase large terminal subunit
MGRLRVGFGIKTLMLPCENYYRPEILDNELDALFDPFWQFGAVSAELASDRDFVCVDYKGTSAVLQNFRGELRAFANVCSHRLACRAARVSRWMIASCCA